MDQALVVCCPGCGTPDYVRNVRDIHDSAAQFTGTGGSIPYVGLLARMTELPQPPSPPAPPALTPPPMALATLDSLVRSRRHLLRFLAIVLIPAVSWLVAALVLAVLVFSRQAGSPSLSYQVAVTLLIGFPVVLVVSAVVIAPFYWGCALLVQRHRQRWLQAAWTAYNATVAGIRNRAAALRAAHDSALRRAQNALGSASYCQQCGGCFWHAPTGGDVPVGMVLTPDEFRAALAQAGEYADPRPGKEP